jgi:hypothetical protein
MSQDLNFSNALFKDYDTYKENSINRRRFNHSEIIPLINKLKTNPLFQVEEKGLSAEGREIYLITLGSGKTKVFLWSQMHGDEPTATMTLLDIFNFFSSSDQYDSIKKAILNNLTIYIMPLVNPDGAQVYKRRNSFDIDINRDALRTATPEGAILRKTFEELKADFGFNLHDQSTRYSAGISPKSATISFLAPAFNVEKQVNDVRENAIRLIGAMHNHLSQFIPGHIAKYSDDFEPRAFGDNFQKWGTSTILIESGGWKDDPEKQFIRKLNFLAILSAFNNISDKSYKNVPTEVYDSIPFNERYLFDLILRNLNTRKHDIDYKIDIGINLYEISVPGSADYYIRGVVEDIGDLSTFYGYEDIDLNGYSITDGAIKDTTISSLEDIKNFDFSSLYSRGFTGISTNIENISSRSTKFPINIYLKKTYSPDNYIEMGELANYVISDNNGIKFVIINGFMYDLMNRKGSIRNALIFR